MSTWYFATALVKAPRPVLRTILQGKEPNARILFNDPDRALLSECGRYEGLSDWIYDMGLLEDRATMLVSWSVEADRGGIWAMRAGRVFHSSSYEYEDSVPIPKPVSFIEKWAAALELELIALQSAYRLTTSATPTAPFELSKVQPGSRLHSYSFQAECSDDVDRLSLALRRAGICSSMEGAQDKDFLPDVRFQLSANAPLETIRNIMRSVEEGDLMVRTLRPCPPCENSLHP